MVRAFQILAVALIAAAAYFLIRAEFDDAFVTAVLGICSFFLSIRFTIKPRVQERLAARHEELVDGAEEPVVPESEHE
jgi:preprotein translocase subunit SecF